MNKTRIISTVITVCFVSLTTYAQNITETTQTDSLSIDSFYETLPEVMITGERPIVDYSGINVPLVAVCNVPPVARCNVPPQKWLQ